MLTNVEKINRSFLKILLVNNLDEAYKLILEEAILLTGPAYGSIYIAEEKMLKKVYSTLPEDISIQPRKRGYMHKAFSQSSPLVIPIEKFVKVHPEYKKLNVSSVILVPLSYKQEKIGILSINSFFKRRLTVQEKSIIKLFGALTSLALKNIIIHQDLVNALKLRDEFISMAAHELKTPMTSINGYIQLLHKRMANEDNTESTWVKELYSETQRLIYLINELLDITRINAGKQHYSLKPIHVSSLIETNIQKFMFIHYQREVSFTKEKAVDELFIKGDNNKLQQLVEHILDNAEKFSEINKKIYISLVYSKKDITLNVINNAILADNDKKNILKSFYKGKNNYQTGMGLGLFLVKDIVDNHNGKLIINADSEKGTFKISVSFPTI